MVRVRSIGGSHFCMVTYKRIMTIKALKVKIKKKFGTYSRFARIAALDRTEFQKDFLRGVNVDQKYIDKIRSLSEKHSIEDDGNLIASDKVAKLRKAITKAGGVIDFCEKNKQFSQATVKHVLSGRRKNVTDIVASLFKHFNITL